MGRGVVRQPVGGQFNGSGLGLYGVRIPIEETDVATK